MSLVKAIRLTTADESTIDFIVTNLIDDVVANPDRNHLRKLLADERTYILAATINEVVIGYALAYRFPSLYASGNLAYLYDIGVLETHRRKGAGRLLIETLIYHLKADNVHELWLGTAVDNVEGQALFSGTGGIKSGEAFNDFTYHLQEGSAI
ncbi:MAG TPA: GNAT family N-acetyltransferase [Chryseolinea sp.]|nr:GNAT family N-acetyltransferase [Chryseolinea sp.]